MKLFFVQISRNKCLNILFILGILMICEMFYINALCADAYSLTKNTVFTHLNDRIAGYDSSALISTLNKAKSTDTISISLPWANAHLLRDKNVSKAIDGCKAPVAIRVEDDAHQGGYQFITQKDYHKNNKNSNHSDHSDARNLDQISKLTKGAMNLTLVDFSYVKNSTM